MKVLAQRISNNLRYAKVFEWGKLITITGGAQVLVQLTGFLSGIIIIRLLPIQEYAFYTLANTMLGAMIMLSDSGVGSGVMAESGKVWQDREKMGRVLATGLNLRKRFAIISLLFTLPVLVYLLSSHGADWLTILLITGAIIPSALAALSDSLLEIAPKLHQDIKPLQRNSAEVSVIRLALSGLLVFFAPFTFSALFANGLPRIYGNYKLRKLGERFASVNESPDPIIQEAIIRGVKRTLPIVIYSCLSGQLTIWLISFFGKTDGISQIGALSKIGALFNLVLIILSTLIVPRFSRMPVSKQGLLKYFLSIQVGTLAITLVLILGIWLFSDQILWVLGKNYEHLNYQLLLVGISNSIGLMVSVCSQLALSRGWFLNPYIIIVINFVSVILSLTFFKMTSLVAILYFDITFLIITYLLAFAFGLFSIYKLPSAR
ncbi:MAG: polysaccharide biosynthesis protein [Sphingobacteriaceae bacterium]|nr:MAG: polysaccharide biosynthesis protein [Sphingobacteriaceae bacterium]